MKLHELSSKNRRMCKRVGRGNASGHGFSCGRGTKGQGQRKRANVRPGFEGGQTPLWRRMPKLRGFKSNAIKPQVVNVSALDKAFEDGAVINVQSLLQKGLISKADVGVKILGYGKTSKKFKIEIENMSKTAKKAL